MDKYLIKDICEMAKSPYMYAVVKGNCKSIHYDKESAENCEKWLITGGQANSWRYTYDIQKTPVFTMTERDVDILHNNRVSYQKFMAKQKELGYDFENVIKFFDQK